MQNNSTLNFNSFISQLMENKIYVEALRISSITYKIDTFKISKITPHKIKIVCQSFKEKQKNNKFMLDSQQEVQNCDEQHWRIFELQAFVWIVVCYSHLIRKHISQFQQIDWNFFNSIFSQKSLQIIQYQANSLIRSSKNKKKLTQKQNELFSTIMNEMNMEGKWNQISKTLYFRSNKKLLISPQKCREHWFNHLNTKILHGEWGLEEDLKLLEQVQKIGFKWSKISKSMNGTRTQHMVKNRYKSIVSKWKTKYPDESFQKNTKNIMKKIKHELIKNQNCTSKQSIIQQQSNPQSQIDIEQVDNNAYINSESSPSQITTTNTDIKQIVQLNQLMSYMDSIQKCNQLQTIETQEPKPQNDQNNKNLLYDLDENPEVPFESYLKFW